MMHKKWLNRDNLSNESDGRKIKLSGWIRNGDVVGLLKQIHAWLDDLVLLGSEGSLDFPSGFEHDSKTSANCPALYRKEDTWTLGHYFRCYVFTLLELEESKQKNSGFCGFCFPFNSLIQSRYIRVNLCEQCVHKLYLATGNSFIGLRMHVQCCKFQLMFC